MPLLRKENSFPRINAENNQQYPKTSKISTEEDKMSLNNCLERQRLKGDLNDVSNRVKGIDKGDSQQYLY